MDIEEIRRNNLDRLIREQYKTQAAFVQETGANQGEISTLLNKKRVFGERKARKLEKLAGLPEGWFDREEKIGNTIAVIDGNDIPSGAIRIRHVNLTVEAGIDGFSINQIDPSEESAPSYITRAQLTELGCRAENLIEITVHGGSMEPRIFAGDIVRINTAATTPKDGRVYVLNFEGTVVIKRLFREAGGWIIRSDNPDKIRYPDRTFNDRIFVIGEVVQKISTQI